MKPFAWKVTPEGVRGGGAGGGHSASGSGVPGRLDPAGPQETARGPPRGVLPQAGGPLSFTPVRSAALGVNPARPTCPRGAERAGR